MNILCRGSTIYKNNIPFKTDASHHYNFTSFEEGKLKYCIMTMFNVSLVALVYV